MIFCRDVVRYLNCSVDAWAYLSFSDAIRKIEVCIYIYIFSFINLSIQRIYEKRKIERPCKKIPYSFDILSYVGFDAFGKIFFKILYTNKLLWIVNLPDSFNYKLYIFRIAQSILFIATFENRIEIYFSR